MENLNHPIETQELYLKNATNRNVYATCFDFQNIENETPHEQLQDNFSFVPKSFTKSKELIVVGAEDSLVHTLAISNGNKYTTYETFDHHIGPLTAVSFYNQCSTHLNNYSYQTNKSLSHLFLSSSFDSTIKLWDAMV